MFFDNKKVYFLFKNPMMIKILEGVQANQKLRIQVY